MLIEISIILALILLNGGLAMSELAVVSSRPARLRARANRGDRGAATALRLAENPGRFLSAVQIGITLVGILSGALSGATLGVRLSSVLPELGVPARLADEVGVGLVVIAITYLSLIVGELVPKQIALSNPEAVASRVASAMRVLERVAAPLVWVLDRSGRVVLALIGQSGRRSPSVSDEEIRMLIAEAEGAGVIEKAETEMITGVMRVADRTARGLMTPRVEVEIADASETRAEILDRFRRSRRSRLPLSKGGPDDIIGVLHSRDVLLSSADPFRPAELVLPVEVVHEALPATRVIERLKLSEGHMLVVYDEFGHFEGVITPMDVLGAIVGGFDETEQDEPKVVERPDGSLLVAGWMPVDEFADRIGLELGDDLTFETVGGLVLDRAGELPQVGQRITVGGWRIEVVDLDGRRIDKLLVDRVPDPNE
ncbi:hemolysin family protein [Histidinibacterium aquaticum]|uniref:HlyC/CorC family transporter n=1 Tax=Histidinibacterium aquaticum TaxID=2613962 RepID=A0A5J5GKF7_9RHOB|nr:hemolysin family protein [Histidinibacterium aquaticum]KAA9008759.1 HlyC/CorC family transporter [Histidinibacterium aquaticum]